MTFSHPGFDDKRPIDSRPPRKSDAPLRRAIEVMERAKHPGEKMMNPYAEVTHGDD